MPKQRAATLKPLIEEKLGVTLSLWLAVRRDRGDSWQRIAHDVKTATGVDVSRESLRLWHTESAA